MEYEKWLKFDKKTKLKAARIFSILQRNNPSPQTELFYTNNFTFLVSVILSAQTTDISVNKILKKNSAVMDTPEKIVIMGEKKLKEIISSINFYNNKAHNVIQTSRILIEKFNSEVPLDFKNLTSLPGVGVKTANVVLNVLAKGNNIAVDTHVFRVSKRLGITIGKNPQLVENELYSVIPKKFWHNASQWLILHGRYVCKARNPLCLECSLNQECFFYKNKKSPQKKY